MKRVARRIIDIPQNREALIERAAAEVDGCISVGGMARDLGLLRSGRATAPRVFGKLIEFARRRRGWSAERLAQEAGIELVEVVNIELNPNFIPQPRTVSQLAHRLGFSTDRLMELAGLTASSGKPLQEAAVRFAARSESAAQLTPTEQESYEQFVKELVVDSGG